MNSSWSPVVYSRTLDVDFRFLAVPEASDARWAEPFILASMSVAEELPAGPRWLVAQTDRERLVGVTCMARDLVGRDDPQIHDAQRRPLYLFVGYLTARATPAEDFAPGPGYPTRAGLEPQQALAAFAPLYAYVRAHWSEQFTVSPERVAASPRDFGTSGSAAASAEWALNTQPGERALWPDGAGERQGLWAAALARQREPLSLCLGLARQRDALESPFLNATTPSVTTPTRLQLAPPPSQPKAQTRPVSDAAEATGAPTSSDGYPRTTLGLPPVLAIRVHYSDKWLTSFCDTVRKYGYHVEIGSERKRSGSFLSAIHQTEADRQIYLFTRDFPRFLLDLDPDAAKARMQREGLAEARVALIDVSNVSGAHAANAIVGRLQSLAAQSRFQNGIEPFLDVPRAYLDGAGKLLQGLANPPNRPDRSDDD